MAGNHEYPTGDYAFGTPCPTDNTHAANYFGYFGAAAHPETVGFGSGGEQRVSVARAAKPQPSYWARTFGYRRLTLGATGWKGEFIDYRGVVLDTSEGACHTP